MLLLLYFVHIKGYAYIKTNGEIFWLRPILLAELILYVARKRNPPLEQYWAGLMQIKS